MRTALAILLVLVVVAAACGGSTSSVGDGSSTSSSSSSSSSSSGGGSASSTSSSGATGDGGVADASTDAPADATHDANAAECPKTFTAPAGNCTIGLVCEYPEGTCKCLGYCGGVPPPDGDFSHWSCTPKRTDGCPDTKPTAGSACTTAGQSCQYGDCCVQTFTCEQGRWLGGTLTCPA